MKNNQPIQIAFGVCAGLLLIIIGEYYLYYNYLFIPISNIYLLKLFNMFKVFGYIPRIGFIPLFFLCVIQAKSNASTIDKIKYTRTTKILFIIGCILFGITFVMVTRLPFIIYLYPISLLGFLITCSFLPIVLNIKKSFLTDDFNIHTDKDPIYNDYSFNLPTENGYINIVNPFAGILVLGAAGSGKSVSIAEPVIEQMTEKEYSGVVYDFKFPTLSAKVYTEMNKNSDTKVALKIVNFNNLKKSHRVNIFASENLPEVTYAFEYTAALMSNLLPESIKKKDFWIRSSGALLTATIWYLHKHHKRYCTLPHVVDLICNGKAEDLIKMLSTDSETSGMVKSLLEALEKEANTQLAGVLATIQTTLVTINNPKIFWVLSGDDFTMNLNDPKNPTMLCIGTSPETAESLSPVVSCMITVATKLLNQHKKHHSIVLLDEAPQIFIPKLSNLPATARSNKVVTMFMAQNIQQIVQLYSQEECDAILGNLSTQFFGRARDLKTADYVSKVFGKADKINMSYSTSAKESDTMTYGTNESIQQKELLNAQTVFNLKTGYFYGVTIETVHPTFYGKVMVPNPDEVKMDEIIEFAPDANDENINKNYERIRLEILSLLDNKIPRDSVLEKM